jgi:hypothetical protein
MTLPQESRLALDEPARLAPNDWSSVEIRMLECTADGFRASCDIAIKKGAVVTLDVPGVGPARAHITWRRGSQFAAYFDEPVELARTGFMAVNGEAILARLLKERARAHAAGRAEEERNLRGRISEILPMKTIRGRI